MRSAAVIGLAWVLVAAPVGWTQQAQDEEAGEPEAAAEEQPATSAPESPPRSEDSPFDYKASEEISEDLSVSFPVDI